MVLLQKQILVEDSLPNIKFGFGSFKKLQTLSLMSQWFVNLKLLVKKSAHIQSHLKNVKNYESTTFDIHKLFLKYSFWAEMKTIVHNLRHSNGMRFAKN